MFVSPHAKHGEKDLVGEGASGFQRRPSPSPSRALGDSSPGCPAGAPRQCTSALKYTERAGRAHPLYNVSSARETFRSDRAFALSLFREEAGDAKRKSYSANP